MNDLEGFSTQLSGQARLSDDLGLRSWAYVTRQREDRVRYDDANLDSILARNSSQLEGPPWSRAERSTAVTTSEPSARCASPPTAASNASTLKASSSRAEAAALLQRPSASMRATTWVPGRSGSSTRSSPSSRRGSCARLRARLPRGRQGRERQRQPLPRGRLLRLPHRHPPAGLGRPQAALSLDPPALRRRRRQPQSRRGALLVLRRNRATPAAGHDARRHGLLARAEGLHRAPDRRGAPSRIAKICATAASR